MKYTAIIQNYYEERQGYWKKIWYALQDSKVQPERIVIWDNWPYSGQTPTPYWDKRLTIYRSIDNALFGRYAAALLAETEYIFVQDNDLTVGPETIGLLLEAASRTGKIAGTQGCDLDLESTTPYLHRKFVAEGPADVVLGRCWAAPRKALLPGIKFCIENNVQPGRCDDLVFSMASGGGVVVPAEYHNLDEKGVGLSHEPGHYNERDRMARRLLEHFQTTCQ